MDVMYRILLIFFIFLESCSYQIKIKTADQAFASKHYFTAIALYKSEIESSNSLKDKAYKTFKIGQCYKYTSDFEQSLKYFKKAYELNYGLKALEEYAFALKNNGEYEAAILAFQELNEELKGNTEFRKEITICKLNLDWKKQQSEYYFKLLPLNELNENSSDYSPVCDGQGTLYFVSDRFAESDNKNKKFAWSGRSYSNIYVFKNQNLTTFPPEINSPSNEGPFSFNSKLDLLYFTRCGNVDQTEDFCNIFYSSFKDGSWSESEWLDFGFLNCNIIHPAIHPSDSILVFSSDVSGGIGQYDLYISYLRNDVWTKPENLGSVINSSYDEKFPIWYRDTLFFSSNGWPGMGGLDLFKTYMDSNGKWMPPTNLKPSLNSESDDFGLFIDTSFVANDSILLKGYMSSNRKETNNDEIYSVELRKRSRTSTNVKNNKPKFDILLVINFVEHEQYIIGSGKSLDSVELVEKISKNYIQTNEASSVKFKVVPDEKYVFLASKRNYLNNEFEIRTPPVPDLLQDSILMINVEIELIPLIFNQEFTLQELYYDFDKWDIRKDAIAPLEKLRKILFTNPTISILLGSHTDCQGDDNYNLELSRKRAKAAKEWLMNSGISPDRIDYIGYGETNMAISCDCNLCTEEEHQKNRRTTFKLIQR